MPCPFCGTALTIPVNLRWKQAIEPEALPPVENPAFDPFQAAKNAHVTGGQVEKAQADPEFVTNALRQARPIAVGALSAYALWANLRRFLPGCLIALASVCLLACTATGVILYFLQRAG
jgi:hypothetical protein